MPRPVQTSGKRELKPVVVDGFAVPIWRLGDGRFAFSDKYGGPRKVCKFTDEAKCRAEATLLANRVLRGGTVRHGLRQGDVDAWDRILQIAEPFAIAPTVAMEEWAAARRIAGDRSLLDVLRAGLEVVSRPEKKVSEVMEMFLAAKRVQGLSSIYLDELTEDLTTFAKTFGQRPIAGITTDDVHEWLGSRVVTGRSGMPARPIGARRRNNLRNTLVTFWNFARARGLLPPGPTAPQKIEKARDRRAGAVSVYTPGEMRFWISHIKDEFLPWLVIGGFSGVRSEEICPPPESHKDRLRWSDFNWKKGHINIRPEVSKTGERRLVPLHENLLDWLADFVGKTGPVIPEGLRADREAMRLSHFSQRLTARHAVDPASHPHPCPGLRWRHNALRHSYCSYRMAIIKNAPQVAFEAGNSVGIVKKHYHEAQEEDLAAEWFAIRRTQAANVSQLDLRIA